MRCHRNDVEWDEGFVIRPAPTTPTGSWPLVGRDAELDEVAAAIASGEGCYVAGDAGIGKTRLVREAVARVAPGGRAAVWVLVTESAKAVPLSSFVGLLPRDVPATVDRMTLFRAVADELRADGRVLVVDDAHLLGDPGAALVLHVASAGIPVVAITREGAAVPDAVTALWKDGLVPRVELGPLDAAGVANLLAAALDGPVEQSTATRLHRRTAGNPLFLREIVLAGRRAGTFALVDGLWRLLGPMRVERTLTQLVRQHIAHLDADVRTALELLAVAEEWSLGALAPEYRRAVDVLQAEGLLSVDGGGSRTIVRLAHPIVGETIRQGLGPVATRAALHELTRMLAATGVRRRDDRLRLAVWQLEAGEQPDAALLVEAARRALQLTDADLAARLATAACNAGAGLPATIALAAAELERNRFAAANDVLAACESAALASDDAVSYAVQRCYALGIGVGSIDGALAFLSRARPRVSGSDQARLDAIEGLVLVAGYRVHAAAERTEGLATGPDVPVALRMMATTPVTTALTHDGHMNRAIELCNANLSLIAAQGDERSHEQVWVLGPLISALWYAGRFADIEALARPVYDRAVALHDDFMAASAASILGQIALDAHDVGDARRWLQEALTPLTRSDPYGFLASALARLAYADALAGDPVAARCGITNAVAAVRGQLRWHVSDLCRAEVWTLAAEGDARAARALAIAHSDAIAESIVQRILLLHDAVRLDATDADTDTASTVVQLADRCDGARFAAIAAHARSVVAADPRAMLDAVDQLARHHSLLAAADAAAGASRLLAAAGERRRATAAKRRSLELVATAGATPTPAVLALGAPSSSPTLLTAREEQVVALARAGLSNRAIADRLVLSVRTVESHLHRAYTKLGVTSRDSLRD